MHTDLTFYLTLKKQNSPNQRQTQTNADRLKLVLETQLAQETQTRWDLERQKNELMKRLNEENTQLEDDIDTELIRMEHRYDNLLMA